ncbi:DUF4350 domain-containing protein [Actinoplanes solisilvae]|uniref:DUF4350 domain-containing protein n=1 Tax=Actinoplanes solisilvae TaxID=2486853 RepID=UPI000FD95C2C|nr:DUF4350 domain-containing protein [Actinoplanes solisilvae]
MKKVRNWRWLRLAVPIAVVLAVFVTTAVLHAFQQADPADNDYLNPDSQAPIGSARLAEALRSEGVKIRKVATTFEASTTLWAQPNSTLFVTAPEFTDVEHLTEERWLPSGSRVVLVRPDNGFLDEAGWPASTDGERWTAAAPAPGCDLFTSPAAVRKLAYRTEFTSCYDGGVVEFPVGEITIVNVVGAADPFRNDRLDEHGNRDFALNLLGHKNQVIWLDRHERDRWPTSDGPPVTDRPAPDGLGDGIGTPEPEETYDDSGDEPESDETRSGEAESGSDSEDEQPTPTAEPDGAAQQAREQANAFPPKAWAVVLLVLLAGAALAAAAARRLGTPVAERLPSRVPANETMLGHARLYQRGGSRGPSLRILRHTSRRRMTEHLGLPPDATDEDLAEATGLPLERFTEVFDPESPPRRDSHLVAATKKLRDLERDVLNEGETQ